MFFKQAFFLSLILAFALADPLQIATAESPPIIGVTFAQGRVVKLAIKNRSKKRNLSNLIVARSVNGSQHFHTIATRRVQARSTTRIRDRLRISLKQVSYRSRLKGSVNSRWSPEVTLIFQQEQNSGQQNGSSDSGSDSEVQIVSPTPQPTSADDSQPGVMPTPSGSDARDSSLGLAECPRSAIDEIFTTVNQFRSSNGFAALTEHPNLAISSRRFSIKMAKSGTLAHEGWYQNILDAGFVGTSFGQNIGYINSLTPSSIMQGWLESPGHRSNMLKAYYKYLGVGCMVDSRGFSWWTQDFGG